MNKTYIIIVGSRRRYWQEQRYIQILEMVIRALGALVLVATGTVICLIY